MQSTLFDLYAADTVHVLLPVEGQGSQRQFAYYCANRTVNCSNNGASHDCIKVVRRFLRGRATAQDLQDATDSLEAQLAQRMYYPYGSAARFSMEAVLAAAGPKPNAGSASSNAIQAAGAIVADRKRARCIAPTVDEERDAREAERAKQLKYLSALLLARTLPPTPRRKRQRKDNRT